MTTMLACKHPWVQTYFQGDRAHIAMRAPAHLAH
jgi:hypothetical protein